MESRADLSDMSAYILFACLRTCIIYDVCVRVRAYVYVFAYTYMWYIQIYARGV